MKVAPRIQMESEIRAENEIDAKSKNEAGPRVTPTSPPNGLLETETQDKQRNAHQQGPSMPGRWDRLK